MLSMYVKSMRLSWSSQWKNSKITGVRKNSVKFERMLCRQQFFCRKNTKQKNKKLTTYSTVVPNFDGISTHLRQYYWNVQKYYIKIVMCLEAKLYPPGEGNMESSHAYCVILMLHWRTVVDVVWSATTFS